MVAIERLRSLFDLDVETGVLRWQSSPCNYVAAGEEAGTLTNWGYRRVRVDGKVYRTHRIVFAIVHGRWPVHTVDHINRIRDDNRPSNLREATQAENCSNAGTKSNNTSGYRGVSWHKASGKWYATVRVNYKPISLGYYDDVELAGLAASEGRRIYHKEFAT